jgi:hypothetical protein
MAILHFLFDPSFTQNNKPSQKGLQLWLPELLFRRIFISTKQKNKKYLLLVTINLI